MSTLESSLRRPRHRDLGAHFWLIMVPVSILVVFTLMLVTHAKFSSLKDGVLGSDYQQCVQSGIWTGAPNWRRIDPGLLQPHGYYRVSYRGSYHEFTAGASPRLTTFCTMAEKETR